MEPAQGPREDLFDRQDEMAIRYLMDEKETGKPIVGAYCCYAPIELVYAAGGIPVGLCGTKREPIEDAEKDLPANLCPLVKSSYGFIITGTCPFFELADAIIAETTCDAKKKMFELITEYKPLHMIELPQMPDREAAYLHWKKEIEGLKEFLENKFNVEITDEKLEDALKLTNRRRRLRKKLFDYSRISPPVVTGIEKIVLFDVFAGGEDLDKHIQKVIDELEKRVEEGYAAVPEDAPRVLLTGCPTGGDAIKILEEIEDAGGVIVVQEACSGIKPLIHLIEEGSGDPMDAISRKYFQLPCSCMTPNSGRLELLDQLIDEFNVDCVIDAVLAACHTYNIESFRVKELAEKKGKPFLKIETDYSESDRPQMRVRIETLLEVARENSKERVAGSN